MANGVTFYSSAQQIASNYERYKDLFAENKKSELGQSDFLSLMTEQMKSQDFMNPTDNTEQIAQLAQFNTLQQMQQMAYYAGASFASTLVGKSVTLGSAESGNVQKITGVVSAIKLNGESFEIVVNGKSYTMANIMEIGSAATVTTTTPATDTAKKVETGAAADTSEDANETSDDETVLMQPVGPVVNMFI